MKKHDEKLRKRIRQHENYFASKIEQDIENNRFYDPRPKRDWDKWEKKERDDRREAENIKEKIKICDDYLSGKTKEIDKRIARDLDLEFTVINSVKERI